jgi:GxxExxY protein
MLNNLIYPELSYKITGLCFQAQNELGCFAKEKQYADYLEILLVKNKISYLREAKVAFIAKDNKISRNLADFIIEQKIIIECKTKNFITKEDYYQIQRYLSATNIKLGLIINFRNHYLKPKRIINYSYRSPELVD